MNDQAFPIDHYLEAVVQCLDKINYQDNNYNRHERVKSLQYVYSEAAKHFAHLLQQGGTLKASPKKLEATLRTTTLLVVYSWTKVSVEVMAAITIYYSYIVILDDSLLDDSNNGPHPDMVSFFEDLVHGKQQKHPWWRLISDHLPQLLKHYGKFCRFNIIRSTFDCKWFPELRVLNPGQFGGTG